MVQLHRLRYGPNGGLELDSLGDAIVDRLPSLCCMSMENEALIRLGGVPELVIVRTSKRGFILREFIKGPDILDLAPYFRMRSGFMHASAFELSCIMGWDYVDVQYGR